MVSHKKQMQRAHRVYYGQYGGGVNDDLLFYKAARLRQKGYGLGGFFSSLARRFLPFATKYIVPHAKKALLNVANEVLDGNRSIKESLKDNALSAIKNVGRDIVGQSGSGRRRRNIRSKKSKHSVKKSQNVLRTVKRRKAIPKIKSLFD
jgi:hypothetical protein